MVKIKRVIPKSESMGTPATQQQEYENTTFDKVNDAVGNISNSVYDTLIKVGGFGKDVLQGIARSGGTVAKETVDTFKRTVLNQEVSSIPKETIAQDGTILGGLQKLIFGDEPLRGFSGYIEKEIKPMVDAGSDLLESRSDVNVPEKVRDVLSPIIGVAFLGLDFTGAGGEKNVIKQLAREGTESGVSKIARQINVPEDLIESFSKNVAKITDEKEIKAAINKVKEIQQTTNVVRKIQEKKLTSGAKNIFTSSNKFADVAKARQLEFTTPALKRATAKEVSLGLSKSDDILQIKDSKLLDYRISNYARGVREGRVDMKNEIKNLQTELIGYIKQHLPVTERGKLISSVKNANSEKQLKNSLKTANVVIENFKDANKLLKDAGLRRSKIAFVRKAAQINQTAFNEIKREAGITKGLQKAKISELNKAIELLQSRYNFKKDKGLLELESKFKLPSEDEYAKIYNEKKPSLFASAIKGISEGSSKSLEAIDKVIGVVDTRIKNISFELGTAIKRLTFNIDKQATIGKKVSDDFYKKIKPFSKSDKAGYRVFSFAWKANDYNKCLTIAKENGFEKEFLSVRKWLDDIEKRAKDANVEMGHIEDYLPRSVKDKFGLMDYLDNLERNLNKANYQKYDILFRKAILKREKDLGRKLTKEELLQVKSNVLRGYLSFNKINITSGFSKSRILEEVTIEEARFYDDPISSLLKYNEQMNNLIETNKFFKGKMSYLNDGDVDWSKTIGSYVDGLNVTAQKAEELKQLLSARFSYLGTSGFIKGAKNVIYLTLMNNYLRAVTQIGDLTWSFYDNGFLLTMKNVVASMSPNTIKRGDVGITKILAEMESGDALSNAVNFIFKTNLIDTVDKFGKETFLNASFDNYAKTANQFLKSGKENKQVKYLKEVFGDEADSVIKEFADGKRTENTMFAIFNRLSDFQPITLSDVPEMYLKHPNGRIFYALKTFTIKSLDVFRREVFNEIKKGNVADGVVNLGRLAVLFVAINSGSDMIKDLIQGKEINITDTMIDNLLSIIGLNRYALDMADKYGAGEAIADLLLPPLTDPISAVSRDIKNAGEIEDVRELKSFKYFPYFGQLTAKKKEERKTIKLKTKGSSGLKVNKITK